MMMSRNDEEFVALAFVNKASNQASTFVKLSKLSENILGLITCTTFFTVLHR